MEKLAIGLTLISFFYVVLLFGMAYCLDYWPVHKEKLVRWMNRRKRLYLVLNEVKHQKESGDSKKAA